MDLTALIEMVLSHGGCTFCSAAGSGDFAGNRADPIEVQFQQIKERMHEKWAKDNTLLTSKPSLTRMRL